MLSDNRNKVIYFAPHQDDELLTMGIDIASRIENGSEVYVVLCTDGSHSRIRTALGDGSFCEKCNEKHVFTLSVEEFIRSRDSEFLSSCSALGVKRENVLFEEKRITDGSLTPQNAEELIKKHLRLIGEDSTVCTIYPNDEKEQHHDHRNLGLAALKLKTDGVISHLELFEEPYVAKIVEHTKGSEPETVIACGNIAERIENALGAYSVFNPPDGRFAIGYHSVTLEMELLKKEKTLYRHIIE